MRLLPPKDKAFYKLFDEMADNLVTASRLLAELVKDDHSDGDQRLVDQLKILETQCDSIVVRTINLLDVAQQPPFDRDDISLLIKSLDDIMDWIEQFASRFSIYRLRVSDSQGLDEIRRLVDVVLASSEKVREAISRLPRRRNIDGDCKAIHDFEAQADEIHHQALAQGIDEVFRLHASMEELSSVEKALGPEQTVDTAELRDLLSHVVSIARDNRKLTMEVFRFFLQREVMKALERASDACDTVATILKRMVVKNV